MNGYIRNEFVSIDSHKPFQVFEAATDGCYKLEVVITN